MKISALRQPLTRFLCDRISGQWSLFRGGGRERRSRRTGWHGAIGLNDPLYSVFVNGDVLTWTDSEESGFLYRVGTSNVVTISDAGLIQAIRDALGKQTGELLETDLLALTTLDASGRSIVNLTGLALATNLTELDIGSNGISDLSPLASMTQLTKLVASNNSISDLSPISGLKTLLIGDNKIRDLAPISVLIQLIEVDISNNQIVDLAPLKELAALEEVVVFGNLIDLSEGSTQRTILEDISTSTGAVIVLVDSRPGLRLMLNAASNQLELLWSETGVLEHSANLVDWVDLESAEPPYAAPADSAKFWRLRKSE